MIFLLSFLLFFSANDGQGAEDRASTVELSPIVKEGTPADVLIADPVVPATPVRNDPSGSVSIVHSLANQLPLPVEDTGSPGAFSQFRGIGRSAEDINFQAFGVPLNPPQGGGLSLAAFPPFLWKDFLVQQGPSLGAFDPRGVSGSILLEPWSAAALGETGSAMLAGALYSDAGAGQWWAALRSSWSGGAFAAAQGFTAGNAQGPSGSLSVKQDFGNVTGSFHLLATDIDAQDPGSAHFPTPNARFRTQRWIPVVQADVRLPSGSLLKSSLYYDGEILRYNDPDSGFVTHDRVEQEGMENALLLDNWRFGLSARRTKYQTLDFLPPDEDALNLQTTYSYEAGGWLLEPTLLAVGVSGFGFLPEGSIGARQEIGSKAQAVFSRISYSRKIPSLANRYYVSPFFVPNAGLQPERDWTLALGWEARGALWKNTLQASGQVRDDAQTSVGVGPGVTTVVNSGQANVGSLSDAISWGAGEGFGVTNATSLNASRISVTGAEFPYLPTFIDVLSLGWDSPVRFAGQSLWGVSGAFRASTSAVTGTPGVRVGGYGTFDLAARLQLARELSLLTRVDNVGDRHYETFLDFPNIGRTFLVQLTGAF